MHAKKKVANQLIIFFLLWGVLSGSFLVELYMMSHDLVANTLSVDLGFGPNIKLINPCYRTAYLYPPYNALPELRDPKCSFQKPSVHSPLAEVNIATNFQPTKHAEALNIELNEENQLLNTQSKDRKKSSKNTYFIESYFYAEFIESQTNFDANGNKSYNENGGCKKSSGKRGRSQRARSRTSSRDNARVSNQHYEPAIQVKQIDPVDCPKCFSTVKVPSFVKHLWDHIWDTISGPSSAGDPSFNLCHHCCRNFKSKQALQSHFLGINWSCEHFCMICMIHFSTEQLQFDHMRTHHVRKSVPIVCKICPYRSSTLFQFWHHYAENHYLPICPFCLEVFYSGEALFITNNHTFIERQADSFYLFNEILQHLQLHASSVGMYDCDKCILTFTCSSDLIVHQKSSHTNVILKKESKQLFEESMSFKLVNFQIPPKACDSIKYFDKVLFKKMLGTLPGNMILSTIINNNLTLQSSNRSSIPGNSTSLIPVLSAINLNSPEQREHDNSELENYICQECMSPLHQQMNELTGTRIHYFTAPLRCRKTFGAEKVRCKFSTRCIEQYVMHEHLHKIRMLPADTLLLTDWSENWPRDPEECLLTCYNCNSYFETYDQLVLHINISKHISLAHSFEEEIRQFNEKKKIAGQSSSNGAN